MSFPRLAQSCSLLSALAVSVALVGGCAGSRDATPVLTDVPFEIDAWRYGDSTGFRITTEHGYRCFDDVLQNGQMTPQIELLEYHGKVCPDAPDLVSIRGQSSISGVFPPNRFTINQNISLLRRFQQVNAAQERTLSGAR